MEITKPGRALFVAPRFFTRERHACHVLVILVHPKADYAGKNVLLSYIYRIFIYFLIFLFLKDMFDCVFPTRTARFGHALVDGGSLNLKTPEFEFDFTPLDSECQCMVCKNYTRSYPFLKEFILG